MLAGAAYNLHYAHPTFTEAAMQNDSVFSFGQSDRGSSTADHSNSSVFTEDTDKQTTAETMQNGSNLTFATATASSNAVSLSHLTEAICSLQNAFSVIYSGTSQPSLY